ncbi:MAG: hypothetical protein P4K83_12470 [Terracidiphilus sp.]|nr:hypothetical protein [Terracidiphilus sp.]
MGLRIAPWKSQPNLAELWPNFFGENENTDIVLADSSFQLYQAVAGRYYSLNTYIDHRFLNATDDPNRSERERHILSLIAGKNYGNSDEFRLALHIFSIDLSNPFVHLHNAREFSATSLEQNNTIIVGSPIANPWSELFNSQMNFTSDVQFVNGDVVMAIKNRAPLAGELPVYIAENNSDVSYCILAFLPSPQHNRKVLLIEGTRSEANEAATNMILSETGLRNLKERMHVVKLPYFEVLLKTTQVRSMPLSYTIEAYRIHANADH